jgi:hypothetical protein
VFRILQWDVKFGESLLGGLESCNGRARVGIEVHLKGKHVSLSSSTLREPPAFWASSIITTLSLPLKYHLALKERCNIRDHLERFASHSLERKHKRRTLRLSQPSAPSHKTKKGKLTCLDNLVATTAPMLFFSSPSGNSNMPRIFQLASCTPPKLIVLVQTVFPFVESSA